MRKLSTRSQVVEACIVTWPDGWDACDERAFGVDLGLVHERIPNTQALCPTKLGLLERQLIASKALSTRHWCDQC
jgi:hypothetical protein